MCMESRTRRYNHYHHYLLIVTNKEQNLLGRRSSSSDAIHHSYRVVLVWGFEDVGIWSLAVVNVDMFPWIDRCV